jgi:hypothetical protein
MRILHGGKYFRIYMNSSQKISIKSDRAIGIKYDFIRVEGVNTPAIYGGYKMY